MSRIRTLVLALLTASAMIFATLALTPAALASTPITFSGTVTLADGTPLSEVSLDMSGPVSDTVMTGSDGRFSLSLTAGDYYYAMAIEPGQDTPNLPSVNSYGYVTLTEDTTVLVVMPVISTVDLSVRDTLGQPVELDLFDEALSVGSVGQLPALLPGASSGRTTYTGHASQDDHSHATVQVFPATYDISYRDPNARWPLTTNYAHTRAVVSGSTSLELTLAALTTYRGRVVASDGHGVAGVDLKAYSTVPGINAGGTGWSDSSGFFSLSIPYGQVHVDLFTGAQDLDGEGNIITPALDPTLHRFTAAVDLDVAGPLTDTIALPALSTLTAEVQDENGVAVAEGTTNVTVHSSAPLSVAGTATTLRSKDRADTDAAGKAALRVYGGTADALATYTSPDDPAGSHRTAARDGVAIGGDTAITLRLGVPVYTLRTTVVPAGDEAPALLGLDAQLVQGGAVVASGTTDAASLAEVSLVVPPGPATLRVSTPPGWSPAAYDRGNGRLAAPPTTLPDSFAFSTALTMNQDRSEAFTLPPTVKATVKITDSSGDPIPGATVSTGSASFDSSALGGDGVVTASTQRAAIAKTTGPDGSVPVYSFTAPTTFTVSYLGDLYTKTVNLTADTDVDLTVVDPGETIATTTSLTQSKVSTVTGEAASVTATVTSASGDPTGNVTFTVDGIAHAPVTLTAGSAVLDVTALAVGSHTIAAAFNGSGPFIDSLTSPVNHVVSRAGTSVVVTTSANPVGHGLPFTVTATVSPLSPGGGTPTGFVMISANYGEGFAPVDLVDGQAVLTGTLPDVGARTYTATYYPDDGRYAGSQSDVLHQTVLPAPTTTYTGRIVTGDGHGVPDVEVDNSSYDGLRTTTTDANGDFSLALVYGPGTIELYSNNQALPIPNFYVSVPVDVTGPIADDLITLPTTQTVTAEVTDADGQAVPAASTDVGLSGTEAPAVPIAGTAAHLHQTAYRQTDASGHAAFQVFPGPVTLDARYRPAGSVASAGGSATATVGTSDLVVPISMGVPAYTLSGRLSKSNGIGVQGLEVGFGPTAGPIITTTTEYGGSFSLFTTSRNGSITLSTPSGGSPGDLGLPDQFSLSAPLDLEHQTGVYVGLPTAVLATVVVTDDHGDPVPGARVSTGQSTFTPITSPYDDPVLDITASQTAETGTLTDSQGRAVVRSFPSSTTFTVDYPTTPVDQVRHYSRTVNLIADTEVDMQLTSAVATTTTLTLSKESTVAGEPATATATVTAAAGSPAGSVTFTLDGTPQPPIALTAGSATADLSALGVGGHTVSAAFTPTTGYAASSSPELTQSISPAETTIVVTSSPNPVVAGQTWTMTATVAAVAPGSVVPQGHVTFYVDGNAKEGFSLNNGVARLGVPGIAVGAHTITARYRGDASTTDSTSNAVTMVINRADTTTTLTSSANPSSFGQVPTVTAAVDTVAPGLTSPVGTVTFTVDGTSRPPVALTGGQAALDLAGLSTASHTILATYSGDTEDIGSSSSALRQVVRAAGTTTLLTSSVNPSAAGQTPTFTAVVAAVLPGAGVPSGSVVFTIDGTAKPAVTLVAGSASLPVAGLSIGTHTAMARYGGSTNHRSSSSLPLSQRVKPATTTVLASSLNPALAGQDPTLTATVKPTAPATGTPTGSVTFTVDGTAMPVVTMSGGKASVVVPGLTVGAHTVVASYGGTTGYSSSASAPFTQNVRAATTTVLSSSANPSVSGQNPALTATVMTTAPGTGTPTGSVTFTVDGTARPPVALSGGLATLSVTGLTVRSHTVTAKYAGTANYLTSTSAAFTQTVAKAGTTTTLTSSANPLKKGTAGTLTATVRPVSPGAGTPTGTVVFTVDGVARPSVTLSGGRATLSITGLAIGTHRITARYAGSTSFVTSTSTTFTQTLTP